MASPPPDIDVLLMEGTNLGTDKPTASEADLEGDFVRLFRETQGRVFVSWSAQNIDRTVTLYRACLKTGRTLAVDLYTAEVLRLMEPHAKIPQPGWPGLKVVVTGALRRIYGYKGRDAFVQEMAAHGIPARRLAEDPAKWTIMLRPSLIDDFENNGVLPSTSDAWSWSMWSGYLKNEVGQRTATWLKHGGARHEHVHTSGHASPGQLKAFANAIRPRWMVPIHGLAWDDAVEGFPPIRRLRDGEPFDI
jgi:ribonuclease J